MLYQDDIAKIQAIARRIAREEIERAKKEKEVNAKPAKAEPVVAVKTDTSGYTAKRDNKSK